ncbi:MAG: ComEA family DNA-binding protein [Planctomycetota bacterium]|jgi:competence ComEA-like helix-hairpin-helix protein
MRQVSQNKIQSFAFIISVCMAACFSCGFVSNIGGGKSTFGRSEIELESRINPNDAPVASLVRLPGLGIGRAGAVVAYRERLSKKNGDGPAFRNCSDLQKVKGIGPKTVQDMSEWLKFE